MTAALSSATIGRPTWSPGSAADPPVRAFLDLSNIWGGVREAAAAHSEAGLPVRLSAENLATLLRAGRGNFVLTTVANADVPAAVISRFRGVGEVACRESGRLTRTEQANDETLQVRMYESMHAVSRAVLVLVTGDGAGWRHQHGFLVALIAARSHGWAVEVVAWGSSTNKALKEWAEEAGAAFVDLNDHYYSVTFVEGGRLAQPVYLRHRRTVEPALPTKPRKEGEALPTLRLVSARERP